MPKAGPPPRLPDRIETERLALLRPQLTDLDEFAAMLAAEELGRWLGQSFDRALSEAALRRDIGHWDTHRFGLWVIRDRASGQLVGRGGLVHTIVGGSGGVEVGWAVRHERWGEGIATEMARAALDAAAGELELDEVVSMTLPDNVASRRVMEKIGLRFDRDVDHRGLPHVLYRGPTRGSAG
jgi:RimJ/RimL family protein N-acetyltransferase